MTWANVIRRAYAANCLYVTKERTIRETLAAAREIVDGSDMWLVHWALIGQTAGHEWCACSVCDELRLTSPPMRRCGMTIDCKGVMVRIAPRPRLTPAVKRNLGMETHAQDR